jgi:trehalose 6-phosphate synthase/phosphatase
MSGICGMNRLFIVSNRLPVTVHKRGDDLHLVPSVGGLATGLGSIYHERNATWIGWPGISGKNFSSKDRQKLTELLSDHQCLPVFLSDYEFEKYYNDICNRAIWPLFHYFSHYAEYDPSAWKSYIKVNKKFCDAVCAVADAGDVIWVHDYQLMLLPRMIREKLPDATIGFFLHIPFPQYEVFRLLPWRKEVLSGILGADLIGFHTHEYVTYFFNSVRRILGYEQEMTRIKAGDRMVKVDTFPMGIYYQQFSSAVNDPQVKKEITRIRKFINTEKIILSVDRLDYTKGVPLRLKAFDALLEDHPELKEHVTFVLVAVPSRTRIDQYTQLKHDVDQLVGRINGRHGTMCWTPVRYLFKSLPFHRLIALYRLSDVALITPLRDGMNLMAKEYLATKGGQPGMLVLSEFAGAAKELGEAVLVNPNNIQELSSAIFQGLTMDEEEKKKRIAVMQMRLARYDLKRWTSDFLDVLEATKNYQKILAARFMDDTLITTVKEKYYTATNRILFLDYDGTLVPIAKMPELAQPDPEILKIIQTLSGDPQNRVIITSGRDRAVLEQWFGDAGTDFIAEHGIWIKERDDEWKMIISVSKEWKSDIRQILEVYVDRTPGTFIEEKEYSLAWHFRNADQGLAHIRSIELREDLMLRTKNLHLALLEGDKVLEVKDSGISKGAAALHLLRNTTYDFIFAVGDDMTDEDLFAALPDTALTIKVGPNLSVATYSLRSVDEVRKLLKELGQNPGTKLKRRKSDAQDS